VVLFVGWLVAVGKQDIRPEKQTENIRSGVFLRPKLRNLNLGIVERLFSRMSCEKWRL
jgi:predicted RecA/RadA family phage recombinase